MRSFISVLIVIRFLSSGSILISIRVCMFVSSSLSVYGVGSVF